MSGDGTMGRADGPGPQALGAGGPGEDGREASYDADGIVACIAFRRDVPDPGHDLLRAFRAGDAEARARVVAAVIAALDAWPHVAPRGTLVVPVPGHRAGASNAPCVALVEELAPSRGWLRADPGTLRRVVDSPEGKAFGPRDPAAEAATLAWDAALVPPGVDRILLVDDVVGSGATLLAACDALPPGWRPRTHLLAAFRSTTR